MNRPYIEDFTTHQPRVIYDQARGSQSLFWDANGNLSQMVDCKTGSASINFWDEENRLRLAVNPKFAGYYAYDANGERVYKLTGSTQYDDLNGSNPSFGIIFDGLTVYPSPYIVLTEKQYTKHYYAGTEKIATMIGDGGLLLAANHISKEQRGIIKDNFYRSFEPTTFQYEKTPNIDIQGNYQSQLEYACGYIDQANLSINSFNPMLEPMMQIWQNSNGCTNEIYYTHFNHLGSASWITDVKGNPIQYIHYAPYGELIANQQTIGYDERYKFTGKERDWETGYDYFGARYYDFRKGFWNSVDPLADNYPGNTPYLYCNGNPIMLIDPDGRVVIAASRVAQERLLSTLSCEERGYVSFDTKGQINLDRLNRCNSTSHNMTALKALANSTDVTYNFYVRSSSTSGETSGEKMIEAGGVTEMYGLDKDASLDPSIVNIISGAHLEGEAAARNMAHEAFTHAYLYEINGHDGRAAGHNRPNKEANQRIYRDPVTGVEYLEYEGVFENHPNDLLNQYNEKAQSEASKNYNCGL